MPEIPAEPPWPKETGVFHTYQFHCHCGAIRWTISISPPLYLEHTSPTNPQVYTATECDCSYCERSGYISVHPLAKNVTFERGFSERGEYFMGKKIVPHWFCKTCASNIGADLSKVMEGMGQEARFLVNLRMLRDYDRSRLNVKRVEFMKNVPPKYEVD